MIADAESERERMMGESAQIILSHAQQFDSHLAQCTSWSNEIRAAVEGMMSVATVAEQKSLQRLLSAPPYLRAVEAAGLHKLLRLMPYPGPRSHMVPLHDELRIYLSKWLTTEVK